MKCYVIMVSKVFPKTHPKAGIDTNFVMKINAGIKKHTIRNNYDFWKNRIDNVKAGTAYISIRIWTGLPYKSKQFEVRKLYGFDGIDLQKIVFDGANWFATNILNTNILANNDGLELDDFNDWFKEPVINKPYALIHLTNYKYV